jgi:hypothetical protein
MAKKVDEDEKVVMRLERIEELLENLIALQGCVAGANRHQLARWIGIDKTGVGRISAILRSGERGKK